MSVHPVKYMCPLVYMAVIMSTQVSVHPVQDMCPLVYVAVIIQN